MAVILGIETSGAQCSISIMEDEESLLFSVLFLPNGQAQILSSMILAAFGSVGKSIKDCSLVAVGKGPGSYTGLRIGASVAAGICFGLNIPILGVSSLENLDFQMREVYPDFDFYLPAFDARRTEVYFYFSSKSGFSVKEAQADKLENTDFVSISEGRSVLVGGDGALKIMNWYSNPSSWKSGGEFFPTADVTARLGYQRFLKQDFEILQSFEPEYLKPVYITG